LSSFSRCVSLSVGGRTFAPCNAAYSLRLKKQVILGILGQINKKVK